MKISCKSVWKFLRKLLIDKHTDNDDYISSLPWWTIALQRYRVLLSVICTCALINTRKIWNYKTQITTDIESAPTQKKTNKTRVLAINVSVPNPMTNRLRSQQLTITVTEAITFKTSSYITVINRHVLVINPAVGCHYCLPGSRLPPQL